VAVKIFRGEDYENLLKDVKRDWVDVHVFTATASRDRSSEVYVVARRS
jgi:23S rRNA U2552 (ribose-2'-O)-methylase RlmE/FtsJ